MKKIDVIASHCRPNPTTGMPHIAQIRIPQRSKNFIVGLIERFIPESFFEPQVVSIPLVEGQEGLLQMKNLMKLLSKGLERLSGEREEYQLVSPTRRLFKFKPYRPIFELLRSVNSISR